MTSIEETNQASNRTQNAGRVGHYLYQWVSDCLEALNTNKLNQYNLVSCSSAILLTNSLHFKIGKP